MKTNRRKFIKTITAGFCAAAGGGYAAQGSSNRLNVGAVGVGGRGWYDWTPLLAHGENIAALCDTNRDEIARGLKFIAEKGGDPSRVRTYTDYRKMLDDQSKLKLDAITVGIPDHSHASVAITAMKLGISCYVEKPLVRTLWEADYFRRTAKECGVVTQMGHQGSASSDFRHNVDVLRSGVLGKVKEIHVWANSPMWPQGRDAAVRAGKAPEDPPAALDWDNWLGTAKWRPYVGLQPKDSRYPWAGPNAYTPGTWRGFRDFGTGAFGDMACHMVNLPYRGFRLGRVVKAEALKSESLAEGDWSMCYPDRSIVRLEYAGGETLMWYDGKFKPPADLLGPVVALMNSMPKSGTLMICEKGIACTTFDYGENLLVAMNGEKKATHFLKHEATRTLPQMLPRREERASSGHYPEFADAVKGIGPVFEDTHSRCFSDTELSVPLLEGLLVGCVAQLVPGEHTWDSAAQRFGDDAANAFLKPYVRPGREF